MATIMTSLAMNDQTTKVLSGITNSLYVALSAMEALQHAMGNSLDQNALDTMSVGVKQTKDALKSIVPTVGDVGIALDQSFDPEKVDVAARAIEQTEEALKSIEPILKGVEASMDTAFDPKNLDATTNSVNQVEGAIKELPQPIDKAEKEQKQFNKSLEKGKDAATGLLKTITGFVVTYLGFRATKGFLTDSWLAASGRTGAEQRLQSIMSNIDGMTQDGIDMLKLYAQELEKTTRIGADVGIFGMSQLGEYVYDPNNIKALTKSMYDLATETYGVGFSQDQLMQTSNLIGKVMMGDINALSRNGFKIDAIFTEAEQKMLKLGTEAQRTALVIQMIEENLDGLSEAMAHTPEGKLHGLRLAFAAIQEKIGYGLNRTLERFYEIIFANTPKIESMFLSVFYQIFGLMDQLITYAGIVGGFFLNNWSWIEPMLWGIGTALGLLIFNLAATATAQGIANIAIGKGTVAVFMQTWAVNGLSAAWATLNTVMKANIFIFIASLIIGLIVWLVKLWQTNDAFAAGLMRTWNGILNFFDKIPIFFAEVGLGVASAFNDMKVLALKSFEELINGAIDGLNELMRLSNDYLGTSFSMFDKVEFAAKAAIEAEIAKEERQRNLGIMKNDAALKAYQREQKVLDMLDNRVTAREERFKPTELVGMGMLPTGDWNIDNIGTVGEVGKIRDKVDISSEDLKMMRELAEMQNIQNFVSLAPTVTVQTGDINNGLDIDTIVANITDRLETQIATSARGVYNV